MFAVFVIALVIGQTLAENHPWTPQHRDASWMKRHERLVNQTHLHGEDEKIVFVGDSITAGWAGNGKAVWAKYYTPRHAYNYGVGGDRTEHVLYRIEHKEFDGLKPKVAVLMIGTNNLKAGHTIEDTAHGVQEVLKQLHAKMPETKVLMLGVLPRNEPLGSKAKELNVLLKKMANEKTVYWLDMWTAYETDTKQHTELYVADHLHLNAKGYEVWHKTMETMFNKLDPTL